MRGGESPVIGLGTCCTLISFAVLCLACRWLTLRNFSYSFRLFCVFVLFCFRLAVPLSHSLLVSFTVSPARVRSVPFYVRFPVLFSVRFLSCLLCAFFSLLLHHMFSSFRCCYVLLCSVLFCCFIFFSLFRLYLFCSFVLHSFRFWIDILSEINRHSERRSTFRLLVSILKI